MMCEFDQLREPSFLLAEAMEVDRHVVAKNSLLITSDRVTTLKGHQSEVSLS